MRKIVNWFKYLLGFKVKWTPEELFEYLCTFDDDQLERLRLEHIKVINNIRDALPEDSQDSKDLLGLLGFMQIGGPRVCTIAQFMEHHTCRRWGMDVGILSPLHVPEQKK